MPDGLARIGYLSLVFSAAQFHPAVAAALEPTASSRSPPTGVFWYSPIIKAVETFIMVHANDTTPRPANRLRDSQSPYLLAHAHNPVDWYPWGPEALEKAHHENKPIFLSIGYSACHWCHVMEREVFADAAIAAIMNQNFINIKVDREERPDLDEIYMLATQLISGSGGWPMSVWLTPDLQPFYAGTYFPPAEGYGRPGFPQLEKAIAEAWRNRPQEILDHVRTVVGAMEEHSRGAGAGGTALVLPQVLQGCIAHHWSRFDHTWGGFGTAPKFPPSQFLSLLLRWLEFHDPAMDAPADAPSHQNPNLAASNHAQINSMLTSTLDGMAAGGIHDQIGGGFARYSTDQRWLVPHFEKMLYDNAQLAGIYARAAVVLRRPEYERVARRTLDFWLSRMTALDGAFFSTLDADSQGHEGRFYVWSADEIRQVFPDAEDYRLLARHLGISDAGNWEGTNVPHIAEPIQRLAMEMGRDVASLQSRIDALCAKLTAVRDHRVPPALDDKIITGWNGLLISALAVAGAAMGETRYTTAAMRALRFIFSHHVNVAGELLRVSRGGVAAAVPGFLEDHAYLLMGVMDLIQAGTLLPAADAAALPVWASRLATAMVEQFYDAAAGGFFMTCTRHDHLFLRLKTAQDNATPSGTAVALHGLVALDRRSGTQNYRHVLENTLRHAAATIQQYPQAHSSLLEALLVHAAVSPDKTTADPSQPLAVLAPRPVLNLTLVAITPAPSPAGGPPEYELQLRLEIQRDYYIAYHPPAPAALDQTIELQLTGCANLHLVRLTLPPPLPISSAPDDTAAYRGQVLISLRCAWQAKPPPGRYDVEVAATAQVCTTGYCLGSIQANASGTLTVE